MNLSETTVWDIELLERRCSMTMNFRLLASIASSSPPSNITIEAVPHEPGADELTGGSSAWMGKIMYQVEYLATKTLGLLVEYYPEMSRREV
jgi:hypothetical protein